MPSSSGTGNNNMRRGNAYRRDSNDRMQRGGSKSGNRYNSNNKWNRTAYQDRDGSVQLGDNKGRGDSNASTSFGPSKSRPKVSSIS